MRSERNLMKKGENEMNDFNGKMKKIVSDMLPKREIIRGSVKRNALITRSSHCTGKKSLWKTVLAACMSLILAAGLFVGGTLLRNMKKAPPISGSGDREMPTTDIATDMIEVPPEERIIKQTIYPLSRGALCSGEDSQYGVPVPELRNLVLSASVFFADIEEGDIDQILPWDTLRNVTPEEIYEKLNCSLYMSTEDLDGRSILYLLCENQIYILDLSKHPVSVIAGAVPVSSQGRSAFSGFFVFGGWGSGVMGGYLYYFDIETRTLSNVFSSSNSVYYLPDGSVFHKDSLNFMNTIRADEYENGEIKYHLVSEEDPAKSILQLIYMPDTHSFSVKMEVDTTSPEQTTEPIGTMETDIGTDETTDTESGFWETETRFDDTTAEDTDNGFTTETRLDETTDEDSDVGPFPVTQPVDTETPDISEPVTTVDPYIPNLSGDYYGKRYCIISPELYSNELFGDDQGNVVSASIARKYLQIEKNFNVKIDVQLISDRNHYAECIRDSVYAGDNSFDVINAIMSDVSSLITLGCVTDWNDLYGSNSLEIFGNKNINSALLLNGGLYCPVTDLSLSSLGNTYVWVYDRDLLGETTEQNLLQNFKNGEWTVDYAYSLVKDFYKDLNGNGERDNGDAYGFVSSSGDYDISGFLIGFGCRFMNNNEYSIDFSKLISARNSLLSFYGSPTAEYHPDFKEAIYYSFNKYDTLSEGASMMFTTILEKLPTVRKGGNFGFLPYPKQTSEQKEYISGMNAIYSMMLLSRTADMSDCFIHDITAALCSNETVIQNYFSNILDGIGQNTAENIRMLELIKESRRFDIAQLIIGVDSIYYHHFVNNMKENGDLQMMKRYTSYQYVYENKVEIFYKKLKELYR